MLEAFSSAYFFFLGRLNLCGGPFGMVCWERPTVFNLRANVKARDWRGTYMLPMLARRPHDKWFSL